MDDVDPEAREGLAVGGADVDRMGGQGSLVENAEIAQALDGSAIAAVFGNVNVETGAERLVGLDALAESFVRESERGVQAEGGRDEAIARWRSMKRTFSRMPSCAWRSPLRSEVS